MTSDDVCGPYQEHDLSFTDAMTVATVREHDIDAALRFDEDYDDVVERLAPETAAYS